MERCRLVVWEVRGSFKSDLFTLVQELEGVAQFKSKLAYGRAACREASTAGKAQPNHREEKSTWREKESVCPHARHKLKSLDLRIS